MAGIYIHIPFCKQACNYCNFYFSTSQVFKNDFLKVLQTEISLQKYYLENQKIESIYFGGGTPSILNVNEIENILESLYNNFDINNNIEITLEANPDDLSKEKLKDLYKAGINRLSIGIQSFYDEDLAFMKRAHNAKEALSCLEEASNIGFKNVSVDLIYGTPGLSNKKWLNNLNTLLNFDINHLSTYALTVEEGTQLYHQIKKGKTENVDEALAAGQFDILGEWASKNNWEQYEISNLCKTGHYSKHNTSYWQGKHYLGLGPAAHSFNTKSRQWNIAKLKKYIESLKEEKLNFEIENLSLTDQYNEYIMTSLRTIWGIDINLIEEKYPKFYTNFKNQLTLIDENLLVVNQNKITLSQKGKFYADGIAASLFMT